MARRKLQIILLVMLSMLLVSTVAYAYVGPELGSRNLRYGMVGGDVRELQVFLNNNGYPVGVADGIFGSQTRKGLMKFQQDHGLAADGIAGPQTLAMIDRVKGSAKYTVKRGSSAGPPAAPVPAYRSLAAILAEKGIPKPIPNLKIIVDKTDHTLTLYSGWTPLKSYHVALGDGGLGDKQVSGDHRTPEGDFYIAERSILSPADRYLGTRWMRLSYPNIEDAQRGLNAGIIDRQTYDRIVSAVNNRQIPPQHTALGGGIGIHGGSNTYDNWGDSWTWGCVALTNSDVNEIYDYIPVGTPVTIKY